MLDRLLEDDGPPITAISGTSAGALNAAVLATGHARGGHPGARDALAAFWHDVSRAGSVFSPYPGNASGGSANPFKLQNLPGYQWVSSFFRSFSPYEFNPLNLNPLRDVVAKHVEVSTLQGCGIALFITATRVETGQARVFTGRDLSIDALMASACLPFLFQAVEIDGEPYWDGRLHRQPGPVPADLRQPRVRRAAGQDQPAAPHRHATAQRGHHRPAERNQLQRRTDRRDAGDPLRVAPAARSAGSTPARYKDLRLHMVADEAGLAAFNASSKYNTDRAFLEQLFGLGREAAARWWAAHAQGRRRALLARHRKDLPRPIRPAAAQHAFALNAAQAPAPGQAFSSGSAAGSSRSTSACRARGRASPSRCRRS